MVNAKTKDGWTALCVAAKRGHSEVVKLLLDRGADTAIKVKDIYTPFNCAVRNGRKEAAELLLPEAPQNGKTVRIRCPGCGSKQQFLINAPLFVADKETRKIFRCTVYGAIWSKRKFELRGSGPGWYYLLLAGFYVIYAFHGPHGISILRIVLAACWMAIGIRHFSKSSRRARTWIQGTPQSSVTE
jgi:Zn finger protein HypA/HybF involved in hydrogenase expression